MVNDLRQQTTMNYPDTWKSSAIDTFERLASMGKVTQADVDEIEKRLTWWRGWRDYFQTTGGIDYTLIEDYQEASGQ